MYFRVPQSVQKIKTAKFHKPYGIKEQKKYALNYIFKALSIIFANPYKVKSHNSQYFI